MTAGETRPYTPCPVCFAPRTERWTEAFGWQIEIPTHNEGFGDCIRYLALTKQDRPVIGKPGFTTREVSSQESDPGPRD